MPKVRFKISHGYHKAGEIADIPSETADQLITAGIAVILGPQVSTPDPTIKSRRHIDGRAYETK